MNRIRRKMMSVNLIVLLMVLSVTTSCSSFTKYAYSTIGTAGVTYDSSMTAFADMYKQGYITEDEKAMAIDIGGKYYEVYMTAVTTLEAYKQLDGVARENKKLELDELLITLVSMGDRIMGLIREFESRAEPVVSPPQPDPVI